MRFVFFLFPTPPLLTCANFWQIYQIRRHSARVVVLDLFRSEYTHYFPNLHIIFASTWQRSAITATRVIFRFFVFFKSLRSAEPQIDHEKLYWRKLNQGMNRWMSNKGNWTIVMMKSVDETKLWRKEKLENLIFLNSIFCRLIFLHLKSKCLSYEKNFLTQNRQTD